MYLCYKITSSRNGLVEEKTLLHTCKCVELKLPIIPTVSLKLHKK